jgi:hypothetical protein
VSLETAVFTEDPNIFMCIAKKHVALMVDLINVLLRSMAIHMLMLISQPDGMDSINIVFTEAS